jgi:hypothetical protein
MAAKRGERKEPPANGPAPSKTLVTTSKLTDLPTLRPHAGCERAGHRGGLPSPENPAMPPPALVHAADRLA